MRKWNEDKQTRARIEIIPMIDVMMFLLVFFVLISINVIPAAGIKTSLPQSSQIQDIRAVKNVVITLAKSGETQISGAVVAIDEIAEKIRAMQKPDEVINIVINSDEGVAVQRLVDVMDALKAAGLDSFSIAAKKKG